MVFGNVAPSSSRYPENSIDSPAKTARKMGHSAGIDWLDPYIRGGLEICGCTGDGLACVLFSFFWLWFIYLLKAIRKPWVFPPLISIIFCLPSQHLETRHQSVFE